MTRFLVIGGGPAGLAAAEVLARAGQGPVTLVERQGETGGIPRHCGHSPFGMREFRRILSGRSYAQRLTAAAGSAGARILLNHSVVAISTAAGQTPEVTLATPDGTTTLAADRILIATGAREATRAERLLPGDRPQGVLNTGALQELWFANRALPFRRPVIVGSELVAMSAILTCRQAGVRVQALVEPGPGLVAAAPYRWLPRTLGIPVLTSSQLTDIVARDGRLDNVLVRDAAGHTRRIDCDGLVLTGAFRPESALARLSGLHIDPATGGPVIDQRGRTSCPAIYAAGNLLRGIETAGACWAEGRSVAQAMLQDGDAAAPATLRPGHGVAYVVPQRFSPATPAALPALQLRLTAKASGTLTLRNAAGRALLCQQIASAPERRIILDPGPLPLPATDGPFTLTLEER